MVTKTQLDDGDLVFTPVANANGTPYTTFTFQVSDGTLESAATYTMTIDLEAVNDAPTGAPTITGAARVGQTLTTSTSGIMDADGKTNADNSITGYVWTYQWVRVDNNAVESDITGATSNTYTLVSEDEGKKLKVKVSYTDDEDSAEGPLPSNPTATIAASAVQPQGGGEECAGSEGKVRLVNGKVSHEGRLELCHDDQTNDATPARWGTVCDDYWTYFEADVVCKALDFKRSVWPTDPERFDGRRAPFGRAAVGVPIWLDNVYCKGSETSLLECTRHANLAIGEHNCALDHSEDVGVRCVLDTNQQVAAPAVTGVPSVSVPAADGAYAENERIEARVVFDAPVVVDTTVGAPTLGLALRGVRREAAYEGGSGTAELVFAHTVASGDAGAGAAKALANGLRLNGATIQGEDGTDAVLDYGSAPGTVSVTVAEETGGDGQWSPSEAVTVAVTFAEPVVVDTTGGTPSIGVLLGGSVAKRAAYTGGTQTATLTFAYSLVAADSAVNSVLVPLNGLALNGGTIRGTGGLDADLEHTGAGRVGVVSRNEPPVLSVADAQATEGETLTFVVTLEPPASAPVTVAYATADGSATAGTDYTAAWGTLSFKAGESEKTVAVTLATDSVPEGSETLMLTLSSPSGATIGDNEATGTVTDPAPAGLNAEFTSVPPEHDGSNGFDLELHFSEAPHGLSYRTLRSNSFFDVTNGTITAAKRLVPRDNRGWLVSVDPDSDADFTIGLAAMLPTDDCADAAVVCTADGTRLSVGAEAGVAGPAGLSVADTSVREGPNATLDFVVTLSRARHETTTVEYATREGTATADDDYTHTAGTLTFETGEEEKTISVPVVDDGVDDDGETVVLTLSKASTPTRITDDTAIGTIENSDPMPKAWLVRFGRTVGSQVIDALSDRFDSSGRSHVTVGGIELRTGDVPTQSTLRERESLRLANWDAETEGQEPERTMTLDEAVAGTRFHVSSGAPAAGGTAYTAWGRVASSGFEAEVDDVTLDGDVTTALVGFDAEWDRALAGVMLSQSSGEGGYRLNPRVGDTAGTVKSTLTGVYPYARFTLNARLSAWALAGMGSGELTLRRNEKKDMPSDISMRMSALGVNADILDAADTGGLALTVKSDAMWVSTKSDASDELRSSEGDVTRLRLTLHGERPFALSGQRTLTPSGEIGVRHDTGDAEPGAGLEVGAGLRYTAGALTVEGRVRALVAHEETGYEEWGASGSLQVAPGTGGRGLTLRIAPAWGATGSATERLWGARDAGELGAGAAQFEGEGRIESEVGYGLALSRNRGLVTPYTALSVGEGASRTWRFGARWRASDEFTVGLEGTRDDSASDAPTNAVQLRAQLRW